MLMMKRFVHQSGQELTRRFFSDWRRRTVALHQQAQHAQEYWTKRIVGTSFNFWHLSLRLKTISSEVYRNTLQHRAFSFWRRRYFEAKRKKEAVELVFLEFRRRHLEHLFKKWKNYTKLRRFCRSKCQQYLRFRLLTWREATKNTFADKLFCSNLLISAWATWRSSLIFSLQGKLADLLYCKRLKSRVLRLWWYRAEGLDLHSQNLVSAAHSSRSATRANPTRRMSIAKAISTKRITREGFFRWRDFAARKVLLASLATHHHNRYLQIIWFRRWKEQASMQLRARRVSDAANKSLLRAFFDSWRKRANSNIRKRNEASRNSPPWSIWARARLKRQQAERTALVSYKRSAFREWHRATWTRIDERVSLRVAYQHRRAIVLRTAFSALQAAVVLRRTLVTTAAIQFLTSRQRRWWRAWRGALEQKRALACAATVADDHHRLNLTFTAFKCWVSKRRDRGLTQRAETFRRRRLCFWAFERWRNVWRLSISAERTARLSVTIAMILQKALVLRIFQAWKSHIQAIHILNGQQEDEQKWPTISRSSMSTVILHGSFTTWRLEHRFRRHNERKAGRILVRTWLAWRSRIGVIEHMKRKGLEAAQRNQVDLLLRVWSHWSSRVMARRDNRRVLVMKRRVLLFWHCWAADQAALRTDADRFRAKSLLNRWRRAVWSSSGINLSETLLLCSHNIQDEAREGTADDFYRRQLLSRTYFRWCRMAALHLGRGLAASDFTLFRTISPRPAAAEIVMANRSILNRLSQARPKGGSDGGTPSARSSRSNSSAILRITADRLLQLSEEAENFRFRTQTARAFSLWRHAYMTARFEKERKLVFADTWAERRLKRRVLWSWKFASPTYTARRIGGLVGSA
ncbi:hypothetical protein DFJ73DRAFT_811142 [Zopfochytrium polystomum]|nr:hypothetical protein DFJ73DRAFT_811142 [Zopfochytrium polystomum]